MAWMIPVLGSVLGGAASGLAGSLGGSGDMKQVSQFTKQQSQLHDLTMKKLLEMMQQGGGFEQALMQLQEQMNPESEFNKNFEQQHLNQFNQQTVPRLAEQFAAGGGGMGGGLSSSGFAQALGGAGANLQTDLAAMKSQNSQNALSKFLGQFNTMSQSGMNAQPFGYQDQGVNPLLAGLGGAASNIDWSSLLSGLSGGGGGNAAAGGGYAPVTNPSSSGLPGFKFKM